MHSLMAIKPGGIATEMNIVAEGYRNFPLGCTVVHLYIWSIIRRYGIA